MILLRPKRVLQVSLQLIMIIMIKITSQVPLIKLLALAKAEVNWPFSLRSLIALRPKWILLSSQRTLVGCLCHHCHNITLILRFFSHNQKFLIIESHFQSYKSVCYFNQAGGFICREALSGSISFHHFCLSISGHAATPSGKLIQIIEIYNIYLHPLESVIFWPRKNEKTYC